MSKSSVAVVVLAIILALGMILGLTGAWFTASGNAGAVAGGKLEFRDNALSVTVTPGTEAKIWRDKDGDNTHETEIGTYAAGTEDLMPGDKIEGSSIKVEFAVNGADGAYYVIIQDGQYYDVDGNKLTAEAAVCKNGDSKTYSSAVDHVIVPEDTKNDQQGQPYVNAQLDLGSVEVRMIQFENMTAEEAFEALTTNWDSVKTA